MKTFVILLTVFLLTAGTCIAQSVEYTKPQPLEVKPFLYLPFKKSDKKEISISETFFYGKEKEIHGQIKHYGIDFDAPEGTAVFAPCSGIAQQGFHTSLIRNTKNFNQPILYQSQTIGFGLGHFTQIWCEGQKVFVMLAHLREVSEKIPKVASVIKNGFEYSPDIYYQYPPDPDMKTKGPKSIRVKRGDYIGRVGHSGLGQFYPNSKGEIDEYETPDRYNPYTWDTNHLHFEVYRRDEKGLKIATERWDSFGWYETADKAPYGEFKQGLTGLFVTNKKGIMKFAK